MAILLKTGISAEQDAAEIAKVRKAVEDILADIEKRGDAAVRDLSQRFDNWSPSDFRMSKGEIEEFTTLLKARPDNYVAQPTLALSTCPTFVGQGVAPRHVDLRPFVLSGRKVTIIPGGLTRVALKEGSLVVNSSQGGGTKDTWVLAP